MALEQRTSIAITGPGTFNSSTLALHRNTIAFFEAEWPAGIVGRLEAQISGRGEIWQTVDGSQVDLDGATSGGQTWTYERCGAPRMRLVATIASGAGQIVIISDAKGGLS